MEVVEHKRTWLAEVGRYRLEDADFDSRENYNYLAWTFWCENTTVEAINSAYVEIKELATDGVEEDEGDCGCDD